MPVLVDTSVWIRALGLRDRDLRARLDALLAADAVLGHPLVYGELLMGDVGGRAAVLHRYAQFPSCVPVAPEAVVAFVRHYRLMGRGMGWTDAQLLAAAVRDRVALWTTDAALKDAAREMSCAFDEA